jgi:hypothetical protein
MEGGGIKMRKITPNTVRLNTVRKMATCPFCGMIPTAEPWHGGGPRKIFIHCEDDNCFVNPGVTGETPKQALSKWNCRAYTSKEQ